MDEKLMPNQFITGEPSVSANPQYLQWIESVKSRYRQSQIKAHLQVNAAVLEFNWYLGHDISEIMRTRIWGSGVIKQSEMRNKILNGQSGYDMTPAKFKILHTWLRKSDMLSRRDDAANQVLAKVVDNTECQEIIFAEKDLYAPMISETVGTASGLHTKLKKIIAEQRDTDFAKYVGGLVKYEEDKE